VPIEPIRPIRLIGQWANVDPNSLSTKRLEILHYGSLKHLGFNHLQVRSYNAMEGGTEESPGGVRGINLYCASVHWENTGVVAGLVHEDHIFAETIYTFKFHSASELTLESFTIFKDGSERRHYFTSERFVKVSGVEEEISQLEEDDAEDEDEIDALEGTSQQLKGQLMPLRDMIDLNDRVVPADQLHGKPLLIDFFATWCGPCRAAAPVLQRLHETYGSRGLIVIGASTGEGDGGAHSPEVREKVSAYVRTHGLTYPVTYGNEAWSEACGVDGYPTFFFVDRDGIVREVMAGYGDSLDGYFEQVVARLLE
jgi:thiol-disulfide isomerase/thioredoxin